MNIIKSGDENSCKDFCYYDSGTTCNTCFNFENTEHRKKKIIEESHKKLKAGNYYWARVLNMSPYITIVYFNGYKYLAGMGTNEGYELSNLEILEEILKYKERK